MFAQAWFFDFIIFSFLLLDGYLIFVVLQNISFKKANTSQSILLVLAIISWLVIFYGSFIESRVIFVRQEQISIADNPQQNLKIALFSDTHVGTYKKAGFVSRIVRKINDLEPDVVLIPGDFVFHLAAEATLLQGLEHINAPAYAVLGNHDYYLYTYNVPPDYQLAAAVYNELTKAEIKVLQNEGELFSENIWIAGVDEIWTDRAHIGDSLRGRPINTPTILLSHNPDIITNVLPENTIDLILSGHTHGGQIRLPFLGPVPDLPTRLGKEIDKGLFQFDDTQMYITSGIGETGTRARLFNPPEIVMIDLVY